MYDRREKKRIQRKWAKVVEEIALQPMDVNQLPRKLTVYISAPPADGLIPAREHFNEYVKPILVSAALDWDAVEGRREGDVRAGLAERIRRLRMKRGEQVAQPPEEGVEDVLEAARARAGVREWDGIPGDIVIGRHTWKEYVRGLHEGWLGPMNPPAKPEEPAVAPLADAPIADAIAPTPEAATASPVSEATSAAMDTPAPVTTPTDDDASPTAAPEPEQPKVEEKPKEEEKKPKKRTQPPPFNTTADYANETLSPNCPQALGPTAILPLPHLLGFLNFPIRMYRFLNRREVADEAGRQTAAAVLAAYRPFEAPGEAQPGPSEDSDSTAQWEQQRLLEFEEPEWHKSVRERKEDDHRERVWLDDMVLDPRIAERMRKFVLEPQVEERAKRMVVDNPEAGWWKSIWPKKEEKKAWEGLADD